MFPRKPCFDLLLVLLQWVSFVRSRPQTNDFIYSYYGFAPPNPIRPPAYLQYGPVLPFQQVLRGPIGQIFNYQLIPATGINPFSSFRVNKILSEVYKNDGHFLPFPQYNSPDIQRGANDELYYKYYSYSPALNRFFPILVPNLPPAHTTNTGVIIRSPPTVKNEGSLPSSILRESGPAGNHIFEQNIRNFGVAEKSTKLEFKCGIIPDSSASDETDSKIQFPQNGSVVLTSLEFDGPNLTRTIFNTYRGYSRIFSSKITYGVPTRNKEAPWQVAMFAHGKFHCGASVISPRYILTAAHCVTSFKLRPEALKLSLGDWDLGTAEDGPNIEAKVKKIIAHEDFSYFDLQNDIALIELDRPVKFNDRIRPLCLPPNDLKVEGERITVTGWGRNENNLLQNKLHKLAAVALENPMCSNRWVKTGAPASIIGQSTFCMDAQYGDSCKGDSGGPAIMEYPPESRSYVLAGIVSFGSGSCTNANLPGVYTRVASFKNWINKHMNDE